MRRLGRVFSQAEQIWSSLFESRSTAQLHTTACTAMSRFSLTSTMKQPTPQGPLSHLRQMLKPTVFCVGTSALYFTVAATADARRREHEKQNFWNPWHRRRDLAPSWLFKLPESLRDFCLEARESWRQLPEERRVIYGLIAVNVAVFCLWRVPALQPFMLKNFAQALPPNRSPLHSMITCTFSHLTPVHLFCNMLALSSFGTTALQAMGKEQFLAFYMSAGLASSLSSVLGRTGSTAGGLSLGASGAVYACFALTALLHPDASAVLIFLPMVPIAMGTLLQLTMGLDMLGVVLGWQALDHWGHLGGASFGVWYTLQGHRLWQERHKLLGVLGGDEKERGKR